MREGCDIFIRVENNRKNLEPVTAEQAAGRELRRLRIEQGWSQEQVARRMTAYGYGWHQTIVAKTEAAQRPLRLNEAVDLAALFGAPLAALLEKSPETEVRAALRAAELEEAERRRGAEDAAALHTAARRSLQAARKQLVLQRETASHGRRDPYAAAVETLRADMIPRGYELLCADCGTDTVPADGPCEYYFVYNEIWEQAGMEKDGGFLCIGCLEARIGRPLHRADFGHAPINVPYYARGQSPRLREALDRKPPAAGRPEASGPVGRRAVVAVGEEDAGLTEDR